MLDPREMDIGSGLTGRLPADSYMWSYRLQDRGLMRGRFDNPITSIAGGTSAA
jgi:hypothetical protein